MRGGWLAERPHTGTKAVIAALILANPHGSGSPGGPRAAGLSALTVIVCRADRVGGWAGQLKQFAPSLVVSVATGSGRAAALGLLERETCDVFITTPHAKLPPRLAKRRFHRIVFDQSHQYEPCSGSSVATARNNTTNYLGTFAWCVSSEPCAARLEQLETQACMLGLWEHGLRLVLDARAQNVRFGVALELLLPSVAEKLRKVMIRHASI